MNSSGGEELDALDPKLFANGHPHDLWRSLRAESPVHFFPNGAIPYWAVTQHRDIKHVSRSPDLFSSEQAIVVSELQPAEMGRPQEMIEMDPPRHRAYRRMISPRFTPRAVGAMRNIVERIVRGVVEALIADGDGECDFVTKVAKPIPGSVTGTLLGVPERDWPLLVKWGNAADLPDLPPEEQQAHFSEFDRYFTQLTEERRREPADDLITLFTQVEENGKKLSLDNILGWAELLTFGGQDTTRAAMSAGLLALIENPDEFARLRRDPSLVKPAVEETLRWASPVAHFARTATVDTELHGQKIRKGDVVALIYASANRDEDVFEDPFRFRIDRSPNPHLAFGVGEHICPGAHVARLEIQTLYEALLPRLAEVELAGAVEYYPANATGGIKRLPVRFKFKDAA